MDDKTFGYDSPYGNEPQRADAERDEADGITTDPEAPSPQAETEKKDEKSISSDLIRGHINTIILRSLADGDKYGYEIIAEIEKKSHGQYTLKQPSLYSALKRLETQGYVTSYWGGSVGGGRRKYFALTDDGKAITEQNRSEWEYSRTIIDSLISDKDFDFNNPAPSSVNMRMLRSTTSRVPTRGEEDTELDYEPRFRDEEERARLYDETRQKEAELASQKDELEKERARFEEEMRAMQEDMRREKEAGEADLLARSKDIEEEKQRLETLLSAQKEQQDESLHEERERYEMLIREREEWLDKERAAHERELEEQARRIREEQEALFRQREQQLIHQNYLSLVNAPPPPPSSQPDYNYYTAPVAQNVEEEEVKQAEPAPAPQPEPEPEPEYRDVVHRIYSNMVRSTAPSSARTSTRSLDGIDFTDLESLAAQDGIQLTTSGGKATSASSDASESIVHKGKALFLSALAVFLLCIAEGSIVLAMRRTYAIPLFYPYFIWGTGLALLLATGLAYANHYGERSLRRTGPVLINAIVSYIIAVIIVLIVALAVNIDFGDPNDAATYLAIPIVFLFGIVVFGIIYYLLTRPQKR